MDATGTAFNLDTKGICLMCLRDCNLYDYFGPPQNKVKKGIGTCTRSISFKMLLRYLKINLFQLCNFPPAFLESMDAGEDTDIVISLCEGCSVLTQSFSRLYESMEEIRMQLDACLQTVYEVMKEGDAQEDRVGEYQRRRRSKSMLEMMTANVADQLRNETIRKCSLKVDALVPRVTMYKREMTSLKGFRPGRGSSSFSQNNGNPPGPHCKLGQNDNYQLKQLLMRPQSKTQFYPDSGTLLNTLANQGPNQGQQRPVATKKSRSRRKTKNEPVYEVPETAPSSEEMVVKVEPLVFANVQQFHNEYDDPLDELEGEMPYQGDGTNGTGQQEQHNVVDDAPTTMANVKSSSPTFYHCSECPRKYVKPSLLLKHQLVFHKQKKNLKVKKRRLRCKFCPKLFVYKANLVLHMKAHPQNTIPLQTDNGTKSPVKKTRKPGKGGGGSGRGRGRLTQPTGTIRCQYCEKWFSSQGVFQTHMVAIHSLQVYKKHLPVGTTEEQLNTVIKSAFDEYIQYPRDHTKKQYGCPYCPQRHPHPSHLRLHIIRGHFDRIAKKLFDDKGLTNEAPEGHDYGGMDGEEFEIEFENGSMDMEGDESSEMFHVEYDYENGYENEGDGEGKGNDSIASSGDQVMVMGAADHNGEEEGMVGEEEEEGDYDDQPPILMRETYSLTERETVIPDQDSQDDEDEAVDSIPIPIVQPVANF